jgi:hypothetical protein
VTATATGLARFSSLVGRDVGVRGAASWWAAMGIDVVLAIAVVVVSTRTPHYRSV